MDNGILSTVTKTPLVSLKKIIRGNPLRLYGKLEMFNPGGSIKDRPALLMLTKALEEGTLGDNTTVIESSSGNMAIGLAQACRYLDLKLIVVVDPKINNHTLRILQTYGVQIDKVSQADASGNYLERRLQRVQELRDVIPDSFWPNQYANPYNPQAHYQTMKEIVDALSSAPDYLLVATSTCGTIMGCANYVQQQNLPTKIMAVDAVGSVIFGTPSANRLVPGHGAGRPSDLLKEEAIDRVFHISDEECVIGCRDLLYHEAILAGGSSGALISAAKKLQADIPDTSTCVLILPDSGERYLDTIYNDHWVREHFGGIKVLDIPENGSHQEKLTTSVHFNSSSHKSNHEISDQNIRKIAIIGGGPKGMYGFERLAAQFKAHRVDAPVEIHVYDSSSYFGAGAIYRPDQPPYLLINNPVGEINMWIEEDPPAVVKNPLSATAWLQQENGRPINPDDYVSRAAVGRYLQHGFEAIVAQLPPMVSGKYMVAEVTDIAENEGRYTLTLITACGHTEMPAHQYDDILLATGHPRNKLTKQDREFQKFAATHNDIRFIPFVYPVESSLDGISTDQKVGIKGIGLTFLDTVLALTEGREGFFKRQDNNMLRYHRSNKEPKVIYPFSRSGLPMIPRTPPPDRPIKLQFFTKQAIDALQKQRKYQKLDFDKHLRPLLKQEMLFAFYNQKMKNIGYKKDLSACDTFAEVQHYINLFHQSNPEINEFNPTMFLEPSLRKSFKNAAAFNLYIQSYLQFFLKEACKGEKQSPVAAVTAVWRKATPVFGAYYQFGGLTPNSQCLFDNKFRRLVNRVTFGAPVESTEKLLALMKCGLLDFSLALHPQVKTDENTGQFRLVSEKFGIHRTIDTLIDARISKVSLRDDRSPLYQNLLNRGIISLFKNNNQQNKYQPGCVAINQQGFVIGKNQCVNTNIVVTGTPTEGITFDNDALSRSRNNFVSEWAKLIREEYAKPRRNENVS